MLIVLDGPAGSGKSSVSKLIANKLKINYLDTGSMYRMITYYFLSENIMLTPENIKQYLDNINISWNGSSLLLNNEDVNKHLRSNEINEAIKIISNNKDVRSKMIILQREIANSGDFVCDGRDLGTVVFPDCQHKFYLTASVDVRANRRYLENQKLGIKGSLEDIKTSIESRDYNDMHREIAPLKQADDAIVIDTDQLSIDQVVDKIISYL